MKKTYNKPTLTKGKTLGDLLEELANMTLLAELTPDNPAGIYAEDGEVLGVVVPVGFIRQLMQAYAAIPRAKPASVMDRLAKAQNGASMVEYALLVALLSIACIATLSALGVSLSALFGQAEQAVMSAGS
jgi:Flp pilus assembly pilin Flp